MRCKVTRCRRSRSASIRPADLVSGLLDARTPAASEGRDRPAAISRRTVRRPRHWRPSKRVDHGARMLLRTMVTIPDAAARPRRRLHHQHHGRCRRCTWSVCAPALDDFDADGARAGCIAGATAARRRWSSSAQKFRRWYQAERCCELFESFRRDQWHPPRPASRRRLGQKTFVLDGKSKCRCAPNIGILHAADSPSSDCRWWQSRFPPRAADADRRADHCTPPWREDLALARSPMTLEQSPAWFRAPLPKEFQKGF